MNLTGRGRPCTFGLATRGSSTVRQLAMKKSANAAKAAPAIQPPHPRLWLRCGAAGFSSAASGMDCSVLISSASFSETIYQVRVDAVGIEGPGHQIAGTHPGPTGPLAERHSGARRTRRRGQHLDSLQ